jgi:hypothetical protein
MNIFRKFFRERILRPLRRRKVLKKLKSDDELGAIKKIWEYRSSENTSLIEDLSIVYNAREDKYYLLFDLFRDFKNDYSSVAYYLLDILGRFTGYMKSKKYAMDAKINIYNVNLDFTADTIEELYAKFKIFVTGFISTYL